MNKDNDFDIKTMEHGPFVGFHPNKDGETSIMVNGEEQKGDWVKGFYLDGFICGQVVDVGSDFICPEYWFAVLPETVKHRYINDLANDIHENAVAHGWWDTEREFGTLLMLITSEAAEALEEYRNGHAINETYYTKDKQGADKMEGAPSELADIIIRVLDICGRYGIDIDAAIREKMAYNASRPYKHGGKKC